MESGEMHSVNLYRIYVPEYGGKIGSLTTLFWFVLALLALFITVRWFPPIASQPTQQTSHIAEQTESLFEYPSRLESTLTTPDARSSELAALSKVEPIPSDLSLTEKFASLLKKKVALERAEILARRHEIALADRGGSESTAW